MINLQGQRIDMSVMNNHLLLLKPFRFENTEAGEPVWEEDMKSDAGEFVVYSCEKYLFFYVHHEQYNTTTQKLFPPRRSYHNSFYVKTRTHTQRTVNCTALW